MTPKLIVLAGLPEKETIELHLEKGAAFTIGRSVECNLPIASIAVSREHCRIITDGEDLRLEDLESHNGTLINELPVKSHKLTHGDKLTIGNAHLVFLTHDENKSPYAVFNNSSIKTSSTIQLLPQFDTMEFTPDLNALVKFGKAINEIKKTEELKKRFLEIILELIPAERGAIVWTKDENPEDLDSICVIKHSNPQGGQEMQISRTVCTQVLSEDIALISNDLKENDLDTAKSLINAEVKSLLCVPLKMEFKKGLIYFDSNFAHSSFTKNHLEQVTALSFLISSALENAKSIEYLKHENEILKDGSSIDTELIGESKAMKDAYYLISKFAPTNSTILITGESGTGKELVAKTIHRNSLRKGKPFLAINCATLNKELLESELFGYEKGAFTGAVAQKKGKIELAESGTVFLDEIGELEMGIQAKLLRFLQEKEFERVGGAETFKADVRILCATNRDLEKEVELGNFRNDLFFRVNVLKIKMPSLSERKSDIPLLTQFFIKKSAENLNRRVNGISAEVKQIFNDYEWKGNVRELENVVERAIVLGTTETILTEDLPDDLSESVNSDSIQSGDFHKQVKEAKQQIIIKALNNAEGNYSAAAESLGIHPNNLHRIIRTLKIKSEIEDQIQ